MRFVLRVAGWSVEVVIIVDRVSPRDVYSRHHFSCRHVDNINKVIFFSALVLPQTFLISVGQVFCCLLNFPARKNQLFRYDHRNWKTNSTRAWTGMSSASSGRASC